MIDKMDLIQEIPSKLETYFEDFRNNTIGSDDKFSSIHGTQRLVYADWIASGRLYGPIEKAIQDRIGPMMANTHSFSSETGKASTYAYKHARQIIKKHVNAGKDDILVTTGTGMTGALSRLQRIMGLRFPHVTVFKLQLPEKDRPIVFISHMEHHSNQVPWMETIADVEIVPSDENQLIDLKALERLLERYRDRDIKIGAFTACSNVTGIITPYHEIAGLMHKYDGYCIADFAASAPYVKIDMHPEDPKQRLDAILFSPHKFLGGPGSCGVLVFNKELYKTNVPDVPGGGNVKWTNPWGEYGYFDDVETKEDGGTPGILQVMRAAFAVRLKEKMDVQNMHKREQELLNLCYEQLDSIAGLHILGNRDVKKIGCLSFYVENIHYNLLVRLLNDRYGIQVRGGWSCASTYGHHLLGICKAESNKLIKALEIQNLTDKPGWVRLSLHPTATNKEIRFTCNAIKDIANNIEEWRKDYIYNPRTNEFDHISCDDRKLINKVEGWFDSF